MDVRPTYICDDCGNSSNYMGPEAIARGSDTRDPGEKVCSGCASRRTLMLRQLDNLPADLPTILSKRSISAVGVA